MVHPYYMEGELLMRYVEDNKQRFEVIVIPQDLSKVVLKLAHDDLGHNGSARMRGPESSFGRHIR